MTGGGNASVSSTRFRPSASIPVLSIARATELWSFLGFGSFGFAGFSVVYCRAMKSRTPLRCLFWFVLPFMSLFMPFIHGIRQTAPLLGVAKALSSWLCCRRQRKFPDSDQLLRSERLLRDHPCATYRTPARVLVAKLRHALLPAEILRFFYRPLTEQFPAPVQVRPAAAADPSQGRPRL